MVFLHTLPVHCGCASLGVTARGGREPGDGAFIPSPLAAGAMDGRKQGRAALPSPTSSRVTSGGRRNKGDMGRSMMGGWGWRRFAALALAGGMLAACAPPPFTVSPSYGAGPRSEYFDRAMLGLLPGQEATSANFISRKIVNQGDNETSRLLSIIAEAGGNCTRSGARYNCLIDRQYVFSGCAFGRCSSSERRWQLRIGWNASEANFIPDVRATVSPPNPITSNS